MLTKFFDNEICFSLGQEENAEFPIVVTESGITISVRLLQLSNVEPLISVKLSESVTSFNSEQFANTAVPIVCTLFAIVTILKWLQPLKALFSMEITLSGIVTFTSLDFELNA